MKWVNPFAHKSEADSNLEEFSDIATGLDIKHFLYAGTCLGFVRDGGYIPWDCDIDVGVLCTEEKLNQLTEALIEHGFRKHSCMPLFFKKRRIVMGVFTIFPPSQIVFLNELDTVEYGGREYFVPHPVEEFLAFAYGDSWRTPIEGITMDTSDNVKRMSVS